MRVNRRKLVSERLLEILEIYSFQRLLKVKDKRFVIRVTQSRLYYSFMFDHEIFILTVYGNSLQTSKCGKLILSELR